MAATMSVTAAGKQHRRRGADHPSSSLLRTYMRLLCIPAILPHKLKIAAKIELGIEFDHVELAEGFEVVRGIPIRVTLRVENIGEEAFPGGELKDVRLNIKDLGASVLDSGHIRELGPGKSTESKPIVLVPFDEGVGWINVTVEAQDGEEIEYYRSDLKDAESPWRYPILSLNREMVQLLETTQELLGELKKREGDTDGEKQNS